MSERGELPLWNLGYALSRLGYRARQTFLEALAPWGLRPAHYGILVFLRALGPVSQRALASATGIDPGDLVGFLDTLEERGYAQRLPDPEDRRRYAVALTGAGQEILRELEEVVVAFNAAFFAPLADERQCFDRLLRKLWDAHEERGTG